MSTGQVPPIDPDIERLDLAPVAKAAAYTLARAGESL